MKFNLYHVAVIGGATILAWLFLRKNNLGTASITPNTAGASISPNDPSVQRYNQPARNQPNPGQIVNTPPYSVPAQAQDGAPGYLTYNFPPTGDFNQSFGGIKTGDTLFNYAPDQRVQNNLIIAAQGANDKGAGSGSCNCGTCQTCTNDCVTLKSRFTDGRGGCMSKNRTAQIKQIKDTNPGLFSNYLENLASANGVGMDKVVQVVGYDHRNNNGAADPGAPGSQVPVAAWGLN